MIPSDPEESDEANTVFCVSGCTHHCHSGLDLVVSGKTTMASEVAEAMKSANAKFSVCAIAMKNQQVDKSQLLPNVQIVPDGIGELVAKQNAGWGYIKVGH